MNVILLGPPGVGKGTQGVLLAEGKEWKHMATGDILRANRREGTDLGKEAQKYMDAGDLVLEAADDVLVKRIAGRRSCPDCGSVFNVYANAPKVEGICDKCGSELVHRPDDNPETVQNRLDVYKAQTEPLIRFYEGREGVVAMIPGEGAVDEIQGGILAAL